MKARIKRTGEVIEVAQTKPGVYIDEEHRTFYVESLSFIHDEEIHWQDVRERAAIAAIQGTIAMLNNSNGYAFREVVVEGYKGEEKTYPKEIAQFAVACADALIEELKRNEL